MSLSIDDAKKGWTDNKVIYKIYSNVSISSRDKIMKAIEHIERNNRTNLIRVRSIKKLKENPYSESTLAEKNKETEENRTISKINIVRVQ